MNIIGIIAEYNPFHRGHAYQIQRLKELSDADYVIIAMSGNFVQRGAPALMDKYSRTRMALSCGADLVLELPALFATASAEYFARGGVSLLNNTGIVTHLGFGAETDNLRLLSTVSGILFEEPDSYREYLHRELKMGASFPSARSLALQNYISDTESTDLLRGTANAKSVDLASSSPAASEITQILASPNNILALEYLQALSVFHSPMIPLPILRQGRGYHDTTVTQDSPDMAVTQDFCSASAIRSCIRSNNFPVPETAMPKASYDILNDYPHPFLFEDDFSPLLHYELITDEEDCLAAWGDSSPELARRLMAEREHFTDWSSFCLHMKTKNFTYARLSRLFTHMLLHIRQEDYQKLTTPSYLRVLGFRKSATPLLSSLKSNSSLPMITSLADAGHLLSPDAKHLLALDLRATELYRLGLTTKGDCTLKNDYKRQIIRL